MEYNGRLYETYYYPDSKNIISDKENVFAREILYYTLSIILGYINTSTLPNVSTAF